MRRRILKNRPPPEEPEIDLYKLPMMKSTSVQRQSIHSINGAIGNELTGLSTCWRERVGWKSPMLGSTSFKIGLPVELVSLTNKGFTLEYTVEPRYFEVPREMEKKFEIAGF